MTERSRQLRMARLSVVGLFAINGLAFSNWFVRIPAVEEHLGLSTSALGLALLGTAVGPLVTMPLAGMLTPRFGSRRIALVATLGLALATALPGNAPNAIGLFFAMALMGGSSGAMDVAMNAQGVEVERRAGRSLMSSFHGGFSVATIVGAGTGALAARWDVDPGLHLAVVAALLVVATLFVQRGLLDIAHERETAGERARLRLPRVLWPAAVIGFCGLLAEGSVSDWSGIFLRRELDAGAGFAALGFAVFAVTMSIGRLTGDAVIDRVGARRVIAGSGLLAAVGMATVVVSTAPWVALVGFLVAGLGLAVTAPIAFSAGARVAGVPAGQGIAAVTTVSYLGFLAGPPFIGLLADATSLRASLAGVALLGLVSAAMSRRLP